MATQPIVGNVYRWTAVKTKLVAGVQTLSDADGTVTAKIRDPHNALTAGNVAHASTGTYTVDVTLTTPGKWTCQVDDDVDGTPIAVDFDSVVCHPDMGTWS